MKFNKEKGPVDLSPSQPAATNLQGGPSDQSALPFERLKVPGISLPKGGGAMRSIDEKFSVNPANGTLGLSIPLPFSPGRGGTTPSLSLQYNAGNGNSAFGLGWNVDHGSIQRKTDKQLPQYLDAAESDVFLMSGTEDLVPFLQLQTNGYWQPVEKTVNGFHIKQYRPRIEGAFSLIERIQRQGESFFYWKVTTGNNIVTFYGKTAAYRIANPLEPEMIFKWLPEFSFDDKGNCVVYTFKEENLDNVLPALHEKNRLNGTARFTNRYLKSVRYANRKAFYPYEEHTGSENAVYDTALPPGLTFLLEAVFDYGEHTNDRNIENPGVKWSARTDAFSDYRAGFEIRTYRLCQRVLMFHHFEELGPEPCLVQSLDLSYQPVGEVTYLRALTARGYIREAAGYQMQAAPPMEFSYQEVEWNREMRPLEASSYEHAPTGLSENYHWIDLYGEGIAGIFTEEGNGWYYKSNEGNGQFSPGKLIAQKPSFTGINNNTLLLQDLEANGQKQAVVNQPGIQGYYLLNAQGAFDSFCSFDGMPGIDFHDPHVKMLDLNGDGQPDVLVGEELVFRWYGAKGKKGYEAPVTVFKQADEELGPSTIFADGVELIVLADMNGDGFTDLVRIRNGEICYWPNMGYGQFGARVVMSQSPVFDSEDQFNPAFLQLVDINGTGAADIIYFGKNRCGIWLNLAGNTWDEMVEIDPFPETAWPARVTVADLLGNGTACIVYSSTLANLGATPLQYIDLMKGRKPHVLTFYKNNRGKEVLIEHRSSTAYYLDDKKAGRSWATRLPFPVHCISKVVNVDKVSGTRFTCSYRYHHGCYDHAEREFRGFAMVETTDTESYEDFRQNSDHPSNQTTEAALFQPPVTTKSWFHTGVYLEREVMVHQLQEEYYQGQQPAWPDKDELPEGLSTTDLAAAFRSLKGMPVHQEIYSYDGSQMEQYPYSVTHHQYQVNLLQPGEGKRQAVFLPQEQSSLVFHYERNPADPRIVHQLNLKRDVFGNVLEAASIAYGRTKPDAGLPTDADREAQSLHYITYSVNDVTAPVVTAQAYRLPVGYQSRTYELKVLLPAAYYFTAGSLRQLFENAVEKPFGGVLAPAEKMKLTHTRTYFLKDDLSGLLPLGEVAPLMLPGQSYQLVFTPPLVKTLFGDKVNDALLREAGNYSSLEGDSDYWLASGRALPYPDWRATPFEKTIPPPTTADVAFAKENFYQPVVFDDSMGSINKIFYDGYSLFPQFTVDAIDNTTRVLSFNYRTFTPCLVQDINGNRSGVRQDALCRVISSFAMGKVDEQLGDLMDVNRVEASMEDQPGSMLRYEHRYYASGGLLPDRTMMQAREQHHYPGTGTDAGPTPVWQTSYSYSDGSGHVVLIKVQAAPGLAPERNAQGELVLVNGALQMKNTGDQLRWIGNGRTIYNNKGKPVKQYEPFFDCLPEYNNEEELVSLGFTPVMYYDAAGRLLRTELPDGTVAFTRFDAWSNAVYDPSDAVMDSPWYAGRIGGDRGAAAQKAAEQAAVHHHTPSISYLDALGRTFLVLAHNKVQYTGSGALEEYKFYVRTSFDLAGNILTVIDTRNNIVTASRFNMIKTACYTKSMDSGEAWMLTNTVGNKIRSWDGEERQFRYTFDTQHRLKSTIVVRAGESVIEQIIYGEELLPEESISNNLRGKMYRHYDTSGVIAIHRHDFKGNLLITSQQLLKDHTTQPDWAATPSLSPEIFQQQMFYDALNRPVQQIMADTSILRPVYDAGGQLFAIHVTLPGKTVATVFITAIQYNAKGQRESIHYGNNTVTRYTYEPETYRLARLLTTAGNGAQILQDLHYTYDPVGNITEILDTAQKTVFYGGQQINAASNFVYDSLYQLIEATGREHAGQMDPGISDNWNDEWCRLQLQPNAPVQLREYRQKYRYDAAGNMVVQQHIAANAGWTRSFEYPATSNRLQKTTCGNQSFTCQYNVHGSLTQLPHLAFMEWTPKEELFHISLGGGGDAWYVYDGNGSRVKKVIERPGGIREERLYLGAVEIYRRIVNNVITLERQTLQIMDNHQRIAMVETRTIGEDEAPEHLQRYQYANHLQTASLELDDKGNVISYEEYHPFGTTAYQAMNKTLKAAAKRYRYTGKERDEESGLYYHGARYYAPWLCRWTTSDPIGVADGLNVYAYVSNNPVMLHDPGGTEGVYDEDAGYCDTEYPTCSPSNPAGNTTSSSSDSIRSIPSKKTAPVPSAATAAAPGYWDDPWYRFTYPGFAFPPSPHDVVKPIYRSDFGSIPLNFIANTYNTISNLGVGVLNGAAAIAALPDDLMRAAGVSSVDRDAVNFHLAWFGFGEASGITSVIKTMATASEYKALATAARAEILADADAKAKELIDTVEALQSFRNQQVGTQGELILSTNLRTPLDFGHNAVSASVKVGKSIVDAGGFHQTGGGIVPKNGMERLTVMLKGYPTQIDPFLKMGTDKYTDLSLSVSGLDAARVIAYGKILGKAKEEVLAPYHVLDNTCTTISRDLLTVGGLNPPFWAQSPMALQYWFKSLGATKIPAKK